MGVAVYFLRSIILRGKYAFGIHLACGKLQARSFYLLSYWHGLLSLPQWWHTFVVYSCILTKCISQGYILSCASILAPQEVFSACTAMVPPSRPDAWRNTMLVLRLKCTSATDWLWVFKKLLLLCELVFLSLTEDQYHKLHKACIKAHMRQHIITLNRSPT